MPKGDYAKRLRYEQEQREMAEQAKLNGNGQTQTPAPQGHTEAPASASARMVSPVGIEWMLTVRDDQVSGLLKKISVLESHLMKEGWTAGPTHSQAPAPQGAAPALGGIPNCPDGHGPMKPSSKAPGEFYCSAVVGTHPQTGKKLYCTHKA